MTQEYLDSLYKRLITEGGDPCDASPKLLLSFDAYCLLLGIENPTEEDYAKYEKARVTMDLV